MPSLFKRLKFTSDTPHTLVMTAYDSQVCTFLRSAMKGRNDVFDNLPVLEASNELVEYDDEAFHKIELRIESKK
jgi:hypothetical protein